MTARRNALWIGCVGLAAALIAPSAEAAGPPILTATSVSAIGQTTATFWAEVNPNNAKTTVYHFQYIDLHSLESEGGFVGSNVKDTPDGPPLAASGLSVPFSAEVLGLTPGTGYRVRAFAENTKHEQTAGAEATFYTHATPLDGLPDERAYEQATPTDKDGGDAVGVVPYEKAASDGSAITFGSDFGVPGGVGSQELPFYLAMRGGPGGWLSRGLNPPAYAGERVRLLGWLPDFSVTYAKANRLGSPTTEALFAQSSGTGALTQITPYVARANFFYVGAAQDGAIVLFRSTAALGPAEGQPPIAGALQGFPNLYVWDRESGVLHLASVLNRAEETHAALPEGAEAGPGVGLRRQAYLQEQHAIGPGGSIFFTARGSGQLYLRLHPTEPQSPLDSQSECEDPALACTLHVSASEKTNGTGPDGHDSAGAQPALFQAASADGTVAFFTSHEMLTHDANTGSEQPPAQIGRATLGGAVEPEGVEEDFLATHALGLVVSPDGEHIYWANSTDHSIGRAGLDASGDLVPGSLEPDFIVPGPVEFEWEEELKGGGFESKEETVESDPRYVAVDDEHVYWTNTGRSNKEGPVDGEGTIGRAGLDASGDLVPDSVKPAWIRGASSPQGIDVNASHVYWANGAALVPSKAIARAEIDGGNVEQTFFLVTGNARTPEGLALSAGHVYFDTNDIFGGVGRFDRIPLVGGVSKSESVVASDDGLRGMAVDASHVYWASRSDGAIGRIPIADFPDHGFCIDVPTCKRDFLEPEGTLHGLAVGPAAHLYWSVNGEASVNPGNDLYRYSITPDGEGHHLTDLTAEQGEENGGEVQGVAGASADGLRLYFAANAPLAPGAQPGSCETRTMFGLYSTLKGKCSLYLREGGTTRYVARLDFGGGQSSDLNDLVATPYELFSTGSYTPKTSFLSDDGGVLLFRSQEKLSEYENEGVPELYLYRATDGSIRCVSCNPSGEAPSGQPSLGSVAFPQSGPAKSFAAPVASRNFAAEGRRVFFETPDALSAADTNGQGGCPASGSASQSYPACMDVYEWEAPGVGSCDVGGPSYSPLNEGCLYLLSTGTGEFPSLFADASESGEDAFFFTRQSLVGQDRDQLQDVYDARVGGGLLSQNPPPPIAPCESADGCHGAAPPAPVQPGPATPTFAGPSDPTPKRKKQRRHRHKRRHAKRAGAHHERRTRR